MSSQCRQALPLRVQRLAQSGNIAMTEDRENAREQKIFAAWQKGLHEPRAIVKEVYTDVAPAMYALAERSVVAHLEKLREEERISREES